MDPRDRYQHTRDVIAHLNTGESRIHAVSIWNEPADEIVWTGTVEEFNEGWDAVRKRVRPKLWRNPRRWWLLKA